MIHQLTESEYLGLFATRMEPRDEDADPPFDFWPYFDAIPTQDFRGHDCSAGTVTHAFLHPEGRYEHVLVDSRDPDVFMVLVLDTQEARVLGHRLLDLLADIRPAPQEPALRAETMGGASLRPCASK